MATAKVVEIGRSLGVILPTEIALRLGVRKGDELFCTETPNGVELSRFDSGFAMKMKIARRIAKRYRNTLRKLSN